MNTRFSKSLGWARGTYWIGLASLAAADQTWSRVYARAWDRWAADPDAHLIAATQAEFAVLVFYHGHAARWNDAEMRYPEVWELILAKPPGPNKASILNGCEAKIEFPKPKE